jgi:hypothetical protein
VVHHVYLVLEASLEFVAYDGRDLLRRPGRTSTAGETVAGGGDVEHFYDDLRHLGFLR